MNSFANSNEKILVRCINKSREGATVVSEDGPKYTAKFSWDDFNKYFIPTDQKHIYEMVIPEDEKTEFDNQIKRYEFIKNNIGLILIAISKKPGTKEWLKYASVLGHIQDKYHQEFPETTMADFINDINQIRRLVGCLFGTGFSA